MSRVGLFSVWSMAMFLVSVGAAGCSADAESSANSVAEGAVHRPSVQASSDEDGNDQQATGTPQASPRDAGTDGSATGVTDAGSSDPAPRIPGDSGAPSSNPTDSKALKSDPRCDAPVSVHQVSGNGNMVKGSPNQVQGNGNLVQGDHLIAIGNHNLVQGTSVCAIGENLLVTNQGGTGFFSLTKPGTSCSSENCAAFACAGGRQMKACVDGECLTSCSASGTSSHGTPYQMAALEDGRVVVTAGPNGAVFR